MRTWILAMFFFQKIKTNLKVSKHACSISNFTLQNKILQDNFPLIPRIYVQFQTDQYFCQIQSNLQGIICRGKEVVPVHSGQITAKDYFWS